MSAQILTRRKWKLYARDQHIVIVKGTQERFVHPLMKALLWALYLPEYPNISVEIHIGDRFKPDVVAFAPGLDLRAGSPVFWGEAGQVNRHKIVSLVRRYPNTHFALAKWNTRLKPHINIVEKALASTKREAPFDLINFPDDSTRFIDDDGNVNITHNDIEWIRL